MRAVLLVLAFASTAFAAKYKNLVWKDCNNDPNRAIKFNSMSISPAVVKVPGDLIGNFDVDVTRDLTGKSEVDLSIYKHRRILRPAKIPCVLGWGSCTYDPCELVKPWETNGCPVELKSQNIPCTCPFPMSKAKMVNQLFKIPDLPWYLDWLAKGDYDVTARLRDTTTGEQLGCLEVSFSIESS